VSAFGLLPGFLRLLYDIANALTGFTTKNIEQQHDDSDCASTKKGFSSA
jgi:hypothetical protein